MPIPYSKPVLKFLLYWRKSLVKESDFIIFDTRNSHMSGFVRVMENLESHGISKKKFQAWKVMEFRSESWKVMENCYNLTFCKNRDENKENSLLSQVFV